MREQQGVHMKTTCLQAGIPIGNLDVLLRRNRAWHRKQRRERVLEKRTGGGKKLSALDILALDIARFLALNPKVEIGQVFAQFDNHSPRSVVKAMKMIGALQ